MDAQEMSFQNVVDSVLKPAGVKVGGYPDDIFLELGDDERERWQCSICYLVSRQAKECDNGHLFCTTCVFAWSMTYGANSDKCPVCRSKQSEYRPRAEVDESIGHKRVRCPEPACNFRAPLTYLLKHSHGAERFGSGNVDLESLRRSRPAPVNPFLAGSGVIFLPLLRAPAGASGAGREGRSLLQDMMMVLHLEMELRRRAIERFSSEEDHVERVRHMTEVLAIQEQMQEITGFLNLLFSVAPQRRSDPVSQDNHQTEHRRVADGAESDDDDADDGEDSSSDSDETSLTAVLSSRGTAAAATGTGLIGRRQLDPPSYQSAAHLPVPAHVLAPMPPAVPRHAAAGAAAVPRGRWRADDVADASSSSSRWSSPADAVANSTSPAAMLSSSSLGMSRNAPLPSPQPPSNVQAVPALQAAPAAQVAPLLRPTLVPHPPLAPPPSSVTVEHSEVAAITGSTALADDLQSGSHAATATPPANLSILRRTPRLDEGRVGETVVTGLAPAGSTTFQAAMRQLPPINRAAISVSPSPRLPEISSPVDLVPVPPPPRERTIFSTRNNDPATSDLSANTATTADDGGLGLPRGVRRVVRRRKVVHGPPDNVTPRREHEPPAGGPVTRSRSQLGNAAAGAPRTGAGVIGVNQPGGEQRPRLNRTRGIDLMLRTRDSSSQRQ